MVGYKRRRGDTKALATPQASRTKGRICICQLMDMGKICYSCERVRSVEEDW